MRAGTKNSAKAENWDVIIVGMGLGGLTCGAYLAQAGKRVLLLEQSPSPGGPCQTYELNGTRFSIGTNTFGRHCDRILKELDAAIAFDPAPLCLSYAGAQVYFPFRFSFLAAARKLGVRLRDVFRLLFQLRHAVGQGKTYAEAIEKLTPSKAIRELLLVESWSIGTPPDILPAEAFRVFFDPAYGYQDPISPREGAHAVPEALLKCIERQGGQFRYGVKATELFRHPDGSWTVKAGKLNYSATQVISNLPPQATLRLLQKSGGASLKEGDHAEIARHRPALSYAALLIALEPNNSFARATKKRKRRRRSTLILASPVLPTVQTLQNGSIPERPIINVVAPAPSLNSKKNLPLTVLTLWPMNGDSSLKEEMQRAMLKILDEEWPGFSSAIKWSELITPSEYETRMGGVSSCPAHVMENENQKPPFNWPFPGLFSVGAAVGPPGSHSAAAMESGRQCARTVLST